MSAYPFLQRKGVTVFMKTVEPIFRAARCSLDVIRTKILASQAYHSECFL